MGREVKKRIEKGKGEGMEVGITGVKKKKKLRITAIRCYQKIVMRINRFCCVLYKQQQ